MTETNILKSCALCDLLPHFFFNHLLEEKTFQINVTKYIQFSSLYLPRALNLKNSSLDYKELTHLCLHPQCLAHGRDSINIFQMDDKAKIFSKLFFGTVFFSAVIRFIVFVLCLELNFELCPCFSCAWEERRE